MGSGREVPVSANHIPRAEPVGLVPFVRPSDTKSKAIVAILARVYWSSLFDSKDFSPVNTWSVSVRLSGALSLVITFLQKAGFSDPS